KLFVNAPHQARVLLAELGELDEIDLLAGAGPLLPELVGIALHRVDAAHFQERTHGEAFVGVADLELINEPHEMAEFRIPRNDRRTGIGDGSPGPAAAVAPLPLGQQLQTAADVVILVARTVALHGDVERNVPALI